MFQYDVSGTNLIVIWASVSRYRTVVYSYLDNKIVKMLSVSSNYYPEFKTSKDRKETVISVSNAEYVKRGQEVTFSDYASDKKLNKFTLYHKEVKLYRK